MKVILAMAVIFFGQSMDRQMVAPKVEKTPHTETQTYITVTRSCPAGYEGHFVDVEPDFDAKFPSVSLYGGEFMGAPGYTVCFKKEFMDEIRKNPDLLTNRTVLRPA
jgi:hypothetical protein